jgi:rRNA maturation protein Nop10
MSTPYDRPARPWDLFNKNLGRVKTDIAQERLAICQQCPFYLPTGICSKCGCFMSAKTKLPNAKCPEDKWGQVRVSYLEEDK